jgi:uncharacterized protein (UPF0332 family)
MLIEKARESLKAAELCFGEGLYNSAANRAYYAMFQAAIVALESAGFQPQGKNWTHEAVHSLFAFELLRKRKLYPNDWSTYLSDAFVIRNQADYKEANVSKRQAHRLLDAMRRFVEAVSRRLVND